MAEYTWVSLGLFHPTYKGYNFPIYNRFMCPPCRCSRWWFQIFVIFTPNLREMIQFDHIFQMSWNHQLAEMEIDEDTSLKIKMEPKNHPP